MPTVAKVQNSAGPDKEWRPDVFHRVHPDQVGGNKLWWFQAVQGISVLSENAVRRAQGKPTTLARIFDRYSVAIEEVVDAVFLNGDGPLHTYAGQDDEWRYTEIEILLAAVMATESGGRTGAKRYEKHLNDWSFGPMQILTRTAAGLNRSAQCFKALKPVPSGGDPDAWAAVLASPETSLKLAATLLKQANTRWKLKGDPMQLYGCYNAGGPYASKQTPWGLRGYDRDGMGPEKGALDWFAAWYGDACAVWCERHGV